MSERRARQTRNQKPTAIEELLDPTSLEDQAKGYARWYRGLALERAQLKHTRLANLDSLDDPAPGPGGAGMVADDQGKFLDDDGKRFLTYKQRDERLVDGMKALRAEAEEEEIWKLVEEKLEEAKRNPAILQAQ